MRAIASPTVPTPSSRTRIFAFTRYVFQTGARVCATGSRVPMATDSVAERVTFVAIGGRDRMLARNRWTSRDALGVAALRR